MIHSIHTILRSVLILIFVLSISKLNAQDIVDSTYLQTVLDSGVASYDNGDYEGALATFQKILSQNKTDIGFSFTSTANYYSGYCYDRLNKPDSAIKYFSQAMPIFEEENDTLKLAKCFYMLSYEYLVLGNYDTSLENNQKALNLFSVKSDTLEIIRSLVWTSIIYHDSRQYELGIEYGEKAYRLIKKTTMPNANLEQRALNSIAINYDDQGDYDMAIAYHQKVFELKDRLSDTLHLAPTYNNIGNSLMKKGDFNMAKKYFLRCLIIDKIRQNQYSLATVYTNLGAVSYKTGNFRQAKIYLDSAEHISYEIMDAEKIQDVLYQQYEYHKKAGELSKALEYLTSFHELKDSLLNIEKVNALSEMEARYKTREQENEISRQTETIKTQKVLIRQNLLINIGLALLVVLLILIGFLYRNRLKKKQQLALQHREIEFKEAQLNSIITTQEKERARFASDLHDSFGQTISILKMNMDAVKKHKDADQRTEKLFDGSTKMLDEMYNELRGICFNLMPHTLIEFGLIEAINELAKRINSLDQITIEVNNHGLETRMEEIYEISLYRIIQEWVNNILKYGNAGLVTIQFTSDDNELTLTIEDDGTGFDKNRLKNSKGNGWKNINSRVQQLGGSIDFDTTAGMAGSILIINVPLSAKNIRVAT